MGLTYVDMELYDPRGSGGTSNALRTSFLVDSGAVYSVVPATVLAEMGVAPKRTERFTLANGEQLEKGVGEVGFRFQGREGTSPVVFGDADDVFLLGAVTLETLGFVLDPFRRELRPLRMMLAELRAQNGPQAGPHRRAPRLAQRRVGPKPARIADLRA